MCNIISHYFYGIEFSCDIHIIFLQAFQFLPFQQVTGFGQDGSGDSGDDWKVICEGGGYFSGTSEYWNRNTPIQLKSVATNRYLGASSTVKFTEQNCGRGCPILNHLEVFGRTQNDSYSHWKVEQGVHLSL